MKQKRNGENILEYTTHIKAKTGLFDINFKELYQYRDLIWLFFKRNYSTMYKQTILGPLWLILTPLISVALYVFIFGSLAGMSTDGTPKFVFYLASNAMWTFFATSLRDTSGTFTANAGIMGKVYFPRLVMPISAVLSGLLNFLIQLVMLAVIMIGYSVSGFHFNLGLKLLLAPVLVFQAGILGLGFGIIIASVTTKYRDLVVLVGFGIQLWMYATPVVYTSELIPEKYINIYMLNPMSPIMECWRNAVIGSGSFQWRNWGISWAVTLSVLAFGIILFSRIEKTFMDTI